MIGSVIQSRYRLQRLVGEGGFGAVFQAEDLKFERDVAIKLLNPTANKNLEHARRFIDEAKLTSQLSHRNIPTVYDYGESEDGQLFIVTELFTGAALEDILERRPLSPSQACWVSSEVNEALIVAHQRGITHRDVKPPNIFIHKGPSGEEVKLLDFGIAKLSNQKSHTLTGQLFGTPYFMSPEQILGNKSITPAADLYSLGAVLFYCLTQTVPFDGDSQFVIFNKHVNAPVPRLETRAPHLSDPRLQEIIELLMQKRPEDRPQNASEARELFIQVDQYTQELELTPRATILTEVELKEDQRYEDQQRQKRVLPRPTERLQPPKNGAMRIPPPLALSTQQLTSSVAMLSEELTQPPLSEWQPTARVDLKEVNDALLGEDDTTDNINARKKTLESTESRLNEEPTIFTRPPQASDETKERERTKIVSSVTSTVSQSAFLSQAPWVAKLIDRKGIAALVFVGGLTLSLLLSIFPEKRSASVSVVPELPTEIPYSSSPVQDELLGGTDQASALPLPTVHPSPQLSEPQLAPPEFEDLALPQVSASKKTPRPKTRKSSPTQSSSARKNPTKKSRSSTRNPRSSSRSTAKIPPKQQSKRAPQAKKSESPSTPTTQKAPPATPLALHITLSVYPSMPSYLPGTNIKLRGEAFNEQNIRVSTPLKYQVAQEGKGWKILKTPTFKPQKSGEWKVRACSSLAPTLCSGPSTLVVFHPKDIIDLD